LVDLTPCFPFRLVAACFSSSFDKVEKRPNTEGTAIVHDVVPGSQAEAAGLKRGDILCFGGSQGQAEMHYDIFLEMAKSDHRPLGKGVVRGTRSLWVLGRSIAD
jgi:hypothetical protein